ncbi:unnamed protein product, partial [Allacma fusca]
MTESRHKGARYDIDLSIPADSFYEGHCLEGKIVFPATGYLWLVWKFFSSQIYLEVDQCPIVFENVRFERLTFLNSETQSTFIVNILQGSGKFEVLESDVVVCSGEIRQLMGSTKAEASGVENHIEINESQPYLNKTDFYKEMHLRGYNYSGNFQGIQEADIEGEWAKVNWTGDWVSFIDSILQINILQNVNRTLLAPTRLKKLILAPSEIKTHLEQHNNRITATFWKYHETTSFPGFELQCLSFANFSSKFILSDPITTEHVFIPYSVPESFTISESMALESATQIAVDNSVVDRFTFTETLSNIGNSIIDQLSIICSFSFSITDFTTVKLSNSGIDVGNVKENGTKVISVNELKFIPTNHLVFTDTESQLTSMDALVAPGGFLLFKGARGLLEFEGYETVTQYRIPQNKVELMILLLRKNTLKTVATTWISTDEEDFNWVLSAQECIRNAKMQQIIFASTSPHSGINGFVKCLVKELPNVKIQCFQAIDRIELNFENPSNCLQALLKKDLLYNIYKGGSWGYFSNITIPPTEFRRRKLFKSVYANALRLGDLSSLSWIESPLNASKQNLVEVHYSSLNFRDVMLASGQLNQASI